MQHAAAPTRGSEGLLGVAPRLLPHASSTPRCRLSNPETPSVFWIRAAAYVSSRSNRRPGPRWRRNGVNRHFLFCAAGNHANPRVAYRSTRLLCAIGANKTPPCHLPRLGRRPGLRSGTAIMPCPSRPDPIPRPRRTWTNHGSRHAYKAGVAAQPHVRTTRGRPRDRGRCAVSRKGPGRVRTAAAAPLLRSESCELVSCRCRRSAWLCPRRSPQASDRRANRGI